MAGTEQVQRRWKEVKIQKDLVTRPWRNLEAMMGDFGTSSYEHLEAREKIKQESDLFICLTLPLRSESLGSKRCVFFIEWEYMILV